MNIIQETERLRLREMNHEDVMQLLTIFSDPVAMKYYPSTKSKSETKEWIEWTLENYRKFNLGLWVVEDLETGIFLGQCGIVPQKVNKKIEMEVGYLFKRETWGNGYATEAASACCEYANEQLGITRLISIIDPANEPSVRVAKRIGMTYEQQMEKWGKLVDIYCYS
ncbi:GNAT family N-acetyltransferase [Geomicrobium sp. JCM 19038]|uniref:GNAT family N-acetyltransferase n=1 Tax=Geomicrobium sp. JCM 19038 TaxID=1460635 RepID=UPI00045F3A6F|nr:GNAT family N-acetyltransferase [Geomicrobium sp. JCM 19038]GAK08389.1 acetyltransferase [Geomicrobium sp. JCM 19038]